MTALLSCAAAERVSSNAGMKHGAAATSAARSVLFVITGLGPGGAERQLVYLALGLRQRGWTVGIAVLTPQLHGEFDRQLKEAGITFVFLQHSAEARLGNLWVAARALLRLVRETRPPVLVGFLVHGALLVRIIGRLRRVDRVVTSLRSIHSRRAWHDRLLALSNRLDDALVTNSSAAAEAQVRARVTTAAKSVVIPNGFEWTRVSSARQDERPDSDRPFRWLALAGFRVEKGHRYLLAAARNLLATHRFELALAGEGPDLLAMQAEADRLGLADVVNFLGNRDDVELLIASADALVLPSLQEGLPNALIEAMGGGLPAVCTDVGGCAELIEPGVSGLLVPPADPEKLAKAMAEMMDLPEQKRRAMGAAGREHVRRNLSLEAMIDRWESVLTEGG